MKYRFLYIALGIEAVVCIVFSILKISASAAFSAVIAFPFEQIGMGLRALSLSGTVGNIIAIVIYAALALSPLGLMLWRGLKKRLRAEDALLAVLSAVLFAVLYLMVNPGSIGMPGGAAGTMAGKIVLGATVYSVLCGYIILRLLRLFFGSGTEKLQKYMGVMMFLLSFLFVYAVFGASVSQLLDAFSTLHAGNQGNEQALGASEVFLVLQFIVNVIPYAADLWIVFAAGRLVSELQTDRYSDASVAWAAGLSRTCKIALIVTILSQIVFNLLQLVFTKSLMVMNSQVSIPVLSVVFVLAVLLIARYLAESKRLKDENDMFV